MYIQGSHDSFGFVPFRTHVRFGVFDSIALNRHTIRAFRFAAGSLPRPGSFQFVLMGLWGPLVASCRPLCRLFQPAFQVSTSAGGFSFNLWGATSPHVPTFPGPPPKNRAAGHFLQPLGGGPPVQPLRGLLLQPLLQPSLSCLRVPTIRGQLSEGWRRGSSLR